MAKQMSSCNNDRGNPEDIINKIRDPDTTQDEQIGILADILVEGFLWQKRHKGNKCTASQEEEK